IPGDILGQAGTAWQVFPNFQIGQGLTSALCYGARPDPSYNPDKCIFEVSVFELYPKGEEPQTEWEYTPVGDPRWRSVLPQDFSNMAAVQQGMKSLGFPGTRPHPVPRAQHRHPAHPVIEVQGTRRATGALRYMTTSEACGPTDVPQDV